MRILWLARGALVRAVPFVLALSMLPACGGAPPAAKADSYDPPPGAPADLGAPAPAPEQPATPGAAGRAVSTAPAAAGQQAKTGVVDKDKAPEALVVYTGEMSMLVEADRVSAALDAAIDVAESLGGHIAGRANDHVKIKVPSAKFRDAMTRIEKLGDVTSRSVSAEDVTAEFRDLEVRLENLRATRKRIEELMARAQTIQDMLTVEKELERVTREIDVIQGRLRFLREHTSFSVLTVRAAAKQKPVIVEPTKRPDPPGPKTIDLPVTWLGTLGIDELFRFPSKS